MSFTENNKDLLLNVHCYHCGDSTRQASYTFDNHHFCCLGCMTVYQVLQDNNLQSYYNYNRYPGKTQHALKEDLSYLDEPKVVTKLVDYQDDELTIITFYVPAIHCSSCIWLLENLFRLNRAIRSSKVDFMKRQVSITFNNKSVSLKEVVLILQRIGYDPKIMLQDVVKEGKKYNQNSLISKITVAGFCFGNSMMISFPEYFGMAEFEREYAQFFGYMNLAFGLPVLFYSASDYFKSAWFSLKQKQMNLDVPLSLGIFVLFLRSAIEIISQTGGGFIDTLCSLVFFILIGKWVQEKTYYHISFERDYRSYFPVAVTVLTDTDEKPTPIADLKVGQRILVRNNEIIPADAILLKGDASIDFSFVTGESNLVKKMLGEIVYAGGRQMGEALELEVVKAVSQSYLTKLWDNENYKVYERPFEALIGVVSRYFTVVLVSVALIAAAFWWIGGDSNRAWAAFTAVLIIACPCALALSSPFTLSAALSVFDKNKLYVKNTLAIEQMAAVDTVVFDKTGTISSPIAVDICFEGKLSAIEKDLLYSLCRNSNHPLSREIIKWLGMRAVLPITDYAETVGKGQSARYLDFEIRVGSTSFIGVKNLEVDGSVVFVMVNSVLKGHFVAEQAWRSDLLSVISELKKDYELHLMSGDNERKAEALRLIFPQNAKLLFNQSPNDKLLNINDWQRKGQVVCMLGDGLNDAGALRKANLGIAVSDDINNFSPGCDAILDGVSFGKLADFFTFSKDAVQVIKMSFIISFLYNIIGVGIAVQGGMSPLFAAILMPISTVTIISFTTLMVRWYAKRRGLI